MNLYGMKDALEMYCLALLGLSLENLQEHDKVAEINAMLVARMSKEGWFDGGKDTITRGHVGVG